MSKSLNKVTLIGNLGADPEIRSTSNGGRVATLSLATGRQWTGPDGAKQEKTEWHRVILWNNKSKGGQQLADLAERFCKKGDKLFVEGQIEYRTYQDKEGQTKYSTEIIGREVILLSGKGESSEGGSSWSGAKSAPAARSGAAAAKTESFDDLPEALDAEDDNLPF